MPHEVLALRAPHELFELFELRTGEWLADDLHTAKLGRQSETVKTRGSRGGSKIRAPALFVFSSK